MGKLIIMFRLVLMRMCSVMRLTSESYVSHVTHVMIWCLIESKCTSSLKHYVLYWFRISVFWNTSDNVSIKFIITCGIRFILQIDDINRLWLLRSIIKQKIAYLSPSYVRGYLKWVGSLSLRGYSSRNIPNFRKCVYF